ncbi:MAG: DUF3160 domain-containing protein, partial [Chloroflexi bacterium]|nr:DUF3160 domain-containing protein [Chloroflexota bacterium]
MSATLFRTISPQKLFRTLLLLLCFLLIFGCRSSEDIVPEFVEPNLQVDNSIRLPIPVDNFSQNLTFDPQSSEYFDLVNDAMGLNEAELAMLAQNGFVITDRLNWNRFVEAYAWIYKNDLPVVVTSDSILHAVHQSYANLLKEIESEVILPELTLMLKATRMQLEDDAKAVTDDSLLALYQDVYDYLSVAIVLAEGSAVSVHGERYTHNNHGNYDPSWGEIDISLAQIENHESERVRELVQLAWEANTATDLNNGNDVQLALFNNPRSIDFTLFEPRAHYNNTLKLGHYFRAMSWLAHADFRFVEFDQMTSDPILNQDSVVAAQILQTAMDNADQRRRWSSLNAVFTHLVGESDNTTLPDLDRLNHDMGWTTFEDVMNADSDLLLNQLLTNDYGQQRITGQLIGRHIDNDSSESIPRPVSFMLMGQRFALDSWIMGNVVYDRLMHEGQPVERPLPTGFDVMVALGNGRAITHLQPELAQYPYEATLATLRQRVDELDDSYWQAPIYNQWLHMIRSLNGATTDGRYPSVMQTAVWADKTLQTQLASWTQLRH